MARHSDLCSLFQYLANDPSEASRTVARGLAVLMARRGIRLRELGVEDAPIQLGLANRVQGRFGQQVTYEDESESSAAGV